MKYYLSIALILCSAFICMNMAFAQVTIDKHIHFISSSTERTIQGIVLNADSSSGVPLSAFLETKLNYVPDPTGASVLYINIPSQISEYKSGMELFIKALSYNTGSISLDINGLGPVEVKKHDTTGFKPYEIIAGQVFRVIYNGSNFILTSVSGLTCPSGFIDVNDDYCIELFERSPASYQVAITTCYSLNARLCTWGEWYYACQNSSLGVQNMVNNYEFIDDASDHTNTVMIVGNGTCKSFSTFAIMGATNYRYRCCYNK
jgi:hypothetical protein